MIATQDIRFGRFDAHAGQWVYAEPFTGDWVQDRLTTASYNVWFYNDYNELRYAAILGILERCGADVIALQEVNGIFLDKVLAREWVRSGYFVSDIRGDTFRNYGVLILSRIPVVRATLFPLPTDKERSLLVAETRVLGEAFLFGSVHLESKKEAAGLRAVQMKTVFPAMTARDNAVLMGDFNFCGTWKDENDRIDPSFIDVWPYLYPDDPGYSEDTEINVMRLKAKGKNKKVRFDRLLLRNRSAKWRWTPERMEILGKEPVSPETPHIFPSDHFGLVASFRVTAVG